MTVVLGSRIDPMVLQAVIDHRFIIGGSLAFVRLSRRLERVFPTTR